MADNIFDEDNLIQLRTSSIAIARLLWIKALVNRDAADGGSAEPVREDCFISRASSKEVMLLAPGEQFPHALCLQAWSNNSWTATSKVTAPKTDGLFGSGTIQMHLEIWQDEGYGNYTTAGGPYNVNAFRKPYFLTEMLSSSMLLCYRTNLLDSGMDRLCSSS